MPLSDVFAVSVVAERPETPQADWIPNVAFLRLRRFERLLSGVGAAAFLFLTWVCLYFGLPPWEWPLTVVSAILVPLWILVVRPTKGPFAFRLEPSGISLKFREGKRNLSRTVPWAAIQTVFTRGRNPTRFWLRLPLSPDQEERERWMKQPVGHVERFTRPWCEVSVDAHLWQRIESYVPSDAKLRLRQRGI